jgi:hypothetical protein
MKHIVENYFNLFLEQAKVLKRVKLSINIYYTGKNEKILSAMGKEDIAALDQTLPIQEESDPTSSSSEKDLQDLGNLNLSDSDAENATVLADDSNVPVSASIIDSELDNMEEIDEQLGAPMELGRMMASRYKNSWRNIPVFLAFSIPVFCMWAFLVETHDINQYENFEQMASSALFVIAAVAFFFVIAVFVEFAVLHFGKFWPKEKLDDFEIYQPIPEGYNIVESDVEAYIFTWTTDYTSEFSSFSISHGRPEGNSVMATARASLAPGIFMCGPVTMVEMVKKETNKENSWFGKTRYCIYNEEFEM